jgi:hypothetical protein
MHRREWNKNSFPATFAAIAALATMEQQYGDKINVAAQKCGEDGPPADILKLDIDVKDVLAEFQSFVQGAPPTTPKDWTADNFPQAFNASQACDELEQAHGEDIMYGVVAGDLASKLLTDLDVDIRNICNEFKEFVSGCNQELQTN